MRQRLTRNGIPVFVTSFGYGSYVTYRVVHGPDGDPITISSGYWGHGVRIRQW